jgi:hypothetical protein
MQTRLIPEDITLTFADTEAELDTAPDYKCQVTHASVDPVLAYNTTPATGCSGEVQQLKVPVAWQLNLTWLQDWNAAGGGLANYANVNAGKVKYFSYTPTADDTLKVTGQVEIAPVGFAGDMGVVSLAGPVVWQVQGQPVFTTPAALPFEADADAMDLDDAGAIAR